MKCPVCGYGVPCDLALATLREAAERARLDAARACFAVSRLENFAGTIESAAPLRGEQIRGALLGGLIRARQAAVALAECADASDYERDAVTALDGALDALDAFFGALIAAQWPDEPRPSLRAAARTSERARPSYGR